MRSACFKAFVRLALPLLVCSTQACSSDKQHLEKQLSKLEDDVRHLQSETDRMGERLDAVEARNTAAPHYAEERLAANPTTVTRPKLKVVRVEPGADDAADDPTEVEAPVADTPDADTGPRVVIEGEGKSIESRTLPGTAPVAAKTAPVSSKVTKGDAKANKAEAPSSK
ncbi:MAG TPA: hypothetical protein VMI54_12080 [Polyangiaceae bacterium]|nr:hypothetical protein [Polyangiaceae bacterium]